MGKRHDRLPLSKVHEDRQAARGLRLQRGAQYPRDAVLYLRRMEATRIPVSVEA